MHQKHLSRPAGELTALPRHLAGFKTSPNLHVNVLHNRSKRLRHDAMEMALLVRHLVIIMIMTSHCSMLSSTIYLAIGHYDMR